MEHQKTIKASDLLVKALETEGVEHVFAVPGEENLDVLDSLRTSSIKLVLTRHEQGAAFMASTYGRLTGKAGVCMATLGPGATNFVTPAAYAHLGGMPLVMITGQKPIKKSKQGQFQIVDIVGLFDPICKMSKQIVHGNTIPALVREAFRLAQEERPGAVLLELPEDIAEEPCDEPVLEPHARYYAVADDKVLDEAAKRIKAAKMPLVLVGAGANRQDARSALSDFVHTTRIPFFNTQMGKGVIDERSDLFLGTAALSDGDYLHCAIDRADLIINVGHDVVEKPPFFMEEGGKQVIHVNYKSAQVDQVYFPQVEVVGDLAASINRLKAKLGRKVEFDSAYFERVKAEVDKHIAEGTDDPRFPIIPQRLVADTRKVMGENDIIALDNGIYKIWYARNYNAFNPNTVLLDNALATMGAGLPSAMMAAMIHPDRRVMAICGDGGFMMNSQELETAVRLGLNLVVTVLNDSSYGMIRWKQVASGFEDWGLEFNNPNFVQYAESYGASGHRVEATEDLIPTFKNAFDAGGVHLVDVPVDYSENQKVLIDELAEKGLPDMSANRTLEVVNPYDLKTIGTVPLANWDKISDSLDVAVKLSKTRASWLPSHQRIDILKQAAKIMDGRFEALAVQIAEEGGKPLMDARIEVARAIDGVGLCIKELSHLVGKEIPMDLTAAGAGRIAFTMREPIGPVVAVSAFNHPLNLIVHQVAPAVAVGCPVLVKPADDTPLSCKAFVDILYEAGLPEEWCHFVPCDIPTAEKMVTDTRVAFFSFIGSAKVGWMLRSKLAPGTRCALEHGGVAPVIVDDTADAEAMIPSLLKGGFYHSGQVCVSVQRVFAPKAIANDIAQRLADGASKLIVGNAVNEDTECGPLIRPREVDRVSEWIDEAKAGGAQVLTGGKKLSDTTYAATVLLDPPKNAKISTAEIFGPAVAVYGYDSMEGAIAQANSLPFAFQAAIFTKNLDRAFQAVQQLDATAVMVNDHTAFRVDWMPFAGRRQSGYNTGGIGYTMHDMTQDKMAVIKT